MFRKIYNYILLILIINSVCEKGSAQNQTAIKDDPCDPYDPPLPDFSRPNQRLSTTKCYEHLWRIKLRIDKLDRKEDCALKKLNRPSFEYGIGGRYAAVGEFPHMAAIGWTATNSSIRYHFKCCGSLISEKFVLTAGHCVRSIRDPQITDPIPKIVRVGNRNINKQEYHIDINIVNIIPHHNYKPPKKYYDLALMKLAEPIEFTNNIQPACLLVDDDVQRLGPSATATGWGITEIGGEPSEILVAVSLELVDSKLCDPFLVKSHNRHWNGLQDHQICAANLSGGVDTCSGDSGGPLQVRIPLTEEYNNRIKMHGIIGVTSFGVKCALRNSPGIYTRVSYFLDWIEDIVWRSEDF